MMRWHAFLALTKAALAIEHDVAGLKFMTMDPFVLKPWRRASLHRFDAASQVCVALQYNQSAMPWSRGIGALSGGSSLDALQQD
jgi:hypothetical protein